MAYLWFEVDLDEGPHEGTYRVGAELDARGGEVLSVEVEEVELLFGARLGCRNARSVDPELLALLGAEVERQAPDAAPDAEAADFEVARWDAADRALAARKEGGAAA